MLRICMKREAAEILIGLPILALGISLLLFTFSSALPIAQNPGGFFQSQIPDSETQEQNPPTASFSWVSNNFSVEVSDQSSPGSAAITEYRWDWGDGSQSNGRNPPTHVYTPSTNESSYEVRLTIRDANGKQSSAVAQVYVVMGETRSGGSMTEPNFDVNIDFNIGQVLLPVGIAVLTIGMYLVMAVVGSAVTKAGWNLIKPRPETIRFRVKPKNLEMEPVYVPPQLPTPESAASLTPAASPPPPPPPGEEK